MRRLLPLFFFLAACTGTPTTTGPKLVTSVVVRAESIVPAAKCGKGPRQIAKYTAVIGPTGGSALGGQTYDCFADALFANMTGSDFTIDVFAWSDDAYRSTASLPSIENDLRDPATAPSGLDNLRRLSPTARVVCKATQFNTVQVIAQCAPATAGDAGTTDAASDATVSDAASD